METAGLTALHELTLRGLHTQRSRVKTICIWKCLCLCTAKLESKFALKGSNGNSGEVVTGTPVCHLLHRPAEASTGWKLKTPQTCETAALLETSALPRRRSLYDAARRYSVSSVFTSGRWEGGSIAAHASSLSHRLVVSPLVPI